MTNEQQLIYLAGFVDGEGCLTHQAIELVKCLMPYLKVKKEEAKVFVSFYKSDIKTSIKLANQLSTLKR